MSHTFFARNPSGSQRHVSLVLFVVALMLSPVLLAGAKPAFPPVVSIEEAGERHRLLITGSAERVVFIFRVYEIAHYAELAGGSPLDPEDVVTDGRGKALMIHFQRDLGVEQIREEFDRSLRRNAQPEWLQEAQGTLATFLAAIDRGARVGDQLQFFWLEGGRLFVDFNEERVFAVRDLAFAKLIWSIWFGADPVCDREDLLALVASGAAP